MAALEAIILGACGLASGGDAGFASGSSVRRTVAGLSSSSIGGEIVGNGNLA